MADLSKIKLNDDVYNLKDTTARDQFDNYYTSDDVDELLENNYYTQTELDEMFDDVIAGNIPVATTTTNGLMSAADKQVLDNLNPNVSVTLSDLYTSEVNVINAKQANMLDLEIIEEPHILEQIRTSNLLDVNDTYGSYYIGSNGAINASTPDTLGPFIPVTPGQVIYYTGHVGETTASSVNRRLHVYTSNQTWIRQLNAATSLRVGQDWSTSGTIPANGAYVRVSWGVTDTNVMISVGAPTKYEPYYLTPFEAITSASFLLSSNSSYSDAITYTITVPAAAGQLYGFTYNPILGKIYKTTAHINSYDGETLPGRWWSDRDVYAEGATPSTGAEVVYMVANQDIVEYDITPLEVLMFYHINYLQADNGEIVYFTYYAETLAATHMTIYDGLTIGSTNIVESNVLGWNHAAEEIDNKAPLESPTFTGSPKAVTPGVATNSTRLATTEFVQTKMNNIAPVETSSSSSQNYEVGDYLFLSGQLYKVTAAIARGGIITPNTNVTATTVMTEFKYLLSLI